MQFLWYHATKQMLSRVQASTHQPQRERACNKPQIISIYSNSRFKASWWMLISCLKSLLHLTLRGPKTQTIQSLTGGSCERKHLAVSNAHNTSDSQAISTANHLYLDGLLYSPMLSHSPPPSPKASTRSSCIYAYVNRLSSSHT